jgi:hypothetical protein
VCKEEFQMNPIWAYIKNYKIERITMSQS